LERLVIYRAKIFYALYMQYLVIGFANHQSNQSNNQFMKLLLLAVTLTLGVWCYAGPDDPADKIGTISGTVIDQELQQPMPFVTVSVQNEAGDIITGGITSDNGTFEIKDLPSGKAMLSIQYIGYKTYTTPIEITRKNRKVDLGTIALEVEAQGLDEVTVVGERSTIEQRADRKVINIGKDLTTAGPTAADIMNNLPSVNVDQQTGSLSLRGNQNVQVMVDGKFTNVPVAQLLRQIPSTSIKQIELITNPSAKYNPEGMSGIINIVLHKNATVGFNGNANFGFTYQDEPKYNTGLDLNYRNGKFNIYGNWGGNYSRNRNYGDIFRPDDNIQQDFEFLDDSNSNLFKAGVDVYINDKNTVSFFTTQNIFNGGTDGTTEIQFFDNTDLNQLQLFSNDTDNNSQQYNFDYKLDFAKEGHNIELEVDYNQFENDEDADFDFEGFSLIEDYEDFVRTERDRTTINLDYTNPLSENSKIEVGGQARLFNSEIGRTSNQQVVNPFNPSLDPDTFIISPTTDFDYTRDIYSLYVNYNQKFGKFSVQLGARFESVDVTADTREDFADGIVTGDLSNITTDPSVDVSAQGNSVFRNFDNDYTQLYPSAFVTYNPSEKNSYQVSYSRRVDRPGIGQVNPIREFSTPLISSFGNASLEPQFTNSIEANYTRNFEKGSITGGVFFRAIEDEINRAVFVDRLDLTRVILTHENFDDTEAYGIEISGNYRPFKWWNFNASFDLFTQTQTGITERLANAGNNPTINDIITETVEVDNTAWNLRVINNFKATKNLTFTAFVFYRGSNRNLQFDVDPMFFTNIGARYTFLDRKLTASVNYNDIFNTMKFQFDGQRPFRQVGEFNWESNTIFAGLSYRFGGGKYRAKSRKRRDNDEKQGSGGIF